jgi:hypothetical protein
MDRMTGAHVAASDPVQTTASRVVEACIEVIERNALTVVVLGICLGLEAMVLRSAVVSDTWYTLVSGRVVSHGLPHHDSLTVLAAGRRWIDQQWLAQLGLYGLWRAGGWAATAFGTVLLFGSALGVLAASARLRGASDRSVALVLAASLLGGAANTVLRAQLAAYVLFAVVLALVLADERRPSRRIYLALPVLVVWANVHGSVLLGAALVSLRGLTFLVGGWRRRELGSVAGRAASLLVLPWACVLASPYGLRLLDYYPSVLDNQRLRDASSEWAHSSLHGQPFFYALLAAVVVLAVLGRRRLTPIGAIALAGTAISGVQGVRNIVWFALVVLAVLPAAVDAVWAPRDVSRRARLNLVLGLGGIAVAIALTSLLAARWGTWIQRPYPAAAAAAVSNAARADPNALVFADERYADWVLFQDPALAGRVAYDARFEIIPGPAFSRIVAFRHEDGKNWIRTIRPYRLVVLGTHDDAGAIRLLEARAGTDVLYRGRDVVVLRQAAT